LISFFILFINPQIYNKKATSFSSDFWFFS
jgi:hypothetical protein